MKNNNSLNYLLEIYKMKIETDGYIMHNYLCNCGEIHTVMFLYNKNTANHTIKNNSQITIIDENNSRVDYSSLKSGDECIAKVYCPSQDLTPSSFMKDIVKGYTFPDDAKFEYYDVFYIQLLGENSAN